MTKIEALLTEAERDVLDHLLEGRTNVDISKRLRLSDKTIKNHISHILAKTGFTNRLQLVVSIYKERERGLRKLLRAA